MPDRASRPITEEPPSSPDASGAADGPEVVLVKVGFKHVAIRIREILHAEAARNYVHVYLENGTVLKSRVQIERLARHLGEERFLRIHRGRLVNMERIHSVGALAGGRLQLTLTQGSTIVVARDRRRAVLARVGALLDRAGRVPSPTRPPLR